MIDVGYPYGEPFQLRLLALLVKRPEKALGIVEPQYFGNPVLADIARIANLVYQKEPGVRLSQTTLRELAHGSLGKKGEEYWPLYKSSIRKIYKMKLDDEPVLMRQAQEFNKEMRYRDALVKAERAITAGNYERVHAIIEEVRKVKGGASASTDSPTLPVYPLHRLLATDFEKEEDYLIGTLVQRGGAVLSYGLPKGLKSWFSTAAALDAAIGDGKVLSYFDCVRPVRVLLVQVEDSASRTRTRLLRLMEARPFRQHPYPGDLRIVTRCPLNLLDPDWLARLEAVIAKYKTELVILDVFRRLFRGNVNSPEETAAFFEVIDGLRDKYATAVWIVHHSRKAESDIMTGALGSINVTGWPEVVLHFKNKHVLGHTTICNLEIDTKEQAIETEFRVVLDDEEEPMLRVEEAKPAQEKLEKAVAQLGPMWTVEELAEALDLKHAGAYKTLQQWIEKGIAVEVQSGSKGHPARYKFATRR